MNFKGHLIGGCVTASVTSIYMIKSGYEPLTVASGAVFAVIASLFPDTDIKSVPSKFFYVAAIFVIIGSAISFNWPITALAVVLVLVSALSPHRGITHSLLFAGAFAFLVPTIVLGYYIQSICVCGLLGYLTHLVLDRHFKLI